MFDMSNDSGLFRTREQLEAEGYRLEGNVFVGDLPLAPSYEEGGYGGGKEYGGELRGAYGGGEGTGKGWNPAIPWPSRALVERAREFRKTPTQSEERLWQALRNKRLAGLKFRRQHPVGPFILDFFCYEKLLAVEVDGPVHDSQREADAERQAWLEAQGIRFARVSADAVLHNLPAVLARIAEAAKDLPPALSYMEEEEASQVFSAGEGAGDSQAHSGAQGVEASRDTSGKEGTGPELAASAGGTHPLSCEERGSGGEVYLPLYEGRLGHQFDHRFAIQPAGELQEVTVNEKESPDFLIESQYYVSEDHAIERTERRDPQCRSALLGFRRVSRNTDERTSIGAVLPFGAASYGWILTFGPDAEGLALLCATYNSFAFDYMLRNSLSQPSIPQGTFQQLPVLPPDTYTQPCPWSLDETLADWLLPRVLELTYTAWDLEGFAKDCGGACPERSRRDGPPFRWDEERRQKLRAELDAAYFHLYLGTPEEWTQEPEALREPFPTPRHAVDYIMETFPIVKRKDEKEYGDYRTKELILHVYDRMQEAIDTGTPYETILTPPPADPSIAHPART